MTIPTHPRRAESACAVPDAVERASDLRATHDVDCDTAAGVAAAYDQRVMEGQAWP